MSDKNKKDSSYDLMQDTQYLLLGLDEDKDESYALEDILAEFGSEEAVKPPRRPEPEPVQEEKPEPAPEKNPKILAFPGAVVPPEENSEDTLVLIDMREYEEEPDAQELFGLSGESVVEPEPEEESVEEAEEPKRNRRRRNRNRKAPTANQAVAEEPAPPVPPETAEPVKKSGHRRNHRRRPHGAPPKTE